MPVSTDKVRALYKDMTACMFEPGSHIITDTARVCQACKYGLLSTHES